jgi:hypothetical protein
VTNPKTVLVVLPLAVGDGDRSKAEVGVLCVSIRCRASVRREIREAALAGGDEEEDALLTSDATASTL